MAVGFKDIKQGSMKTAYDGSNTLEQLERGDLVKIANRRLVWVVGGFMSAAPWLFSGLLVFLYGESDVAFAEQYRGFQKNFVSEGSFLWLSITVLAMSLVEFLLNGFREKLPLKVASRYNWILVLTVIFEVVVVLVYFFNIGKPIKGIPFTILSLVTFVAFIILSWVILFRIIK